MDSAASRSTLLIASSPHTSLSSISLKRIPCLDIFEVLKFYNKQGINFENYVEIRLLKCVKINKWRKLSPDKKEEVKYVILTHNIWHVHVCVYIKYVRMNLLDGKKGVFCKKCTISLNSKVLRIGQYCKLAYEERDLKKLIFFMSSFDAG